MKKRVKSYLIIASDVHNLSAFSNIDELDDCVHHNMFMYLTLALYLNVCSISYFQGGFCGIDQF